MRKDTEALRDLHRATASKPRSPEEELDRTLYLLEKERERHLVMLGVNRILRARSKNDEKIARINKDYGLPLKTAATLLVADPPYRPGFDPFTLANHNKLLKSLEEKALAVKVRVQRKG